MADNVSILADFFGHLLVCVGALIALLSGGCTLVVLYNNLVPTVHWMEIESSLVFGLPFLVLGIGTSLAGFALLRSARARNERSTVSHDEGRHDE